MGKQGGVKGVVQGAANEIQKTLGLPPDGLLGGGGAPPPDYVAAAEKAGQSNRPNQSTPFGFSNWDENGNQQVGLNGGLGDAASGLMGQAGALGQGMDWSQFGQLGDGSDARDQAINAAYGQATSRLDPQWEQRSQLQASQLANQGLDPNSQAYRNAMQQFGQQRNDAYGSAMNSAIGQGTAAGQAVFNQNLLSRQQMVAEALRKRGQPLDELQRLQGFTSMPGAGQGTDYLGAEALKGGYDMETLRRQQQNITDLINGGSSAVQGGATLLPFVFSDERAKEDVVRLEDEAIPGVPWAMWRYKDEYGGKQSFGVIAQDLLKVAPKYVRADSNGMLHVNYGFLEVNHESA